MKKETIVKANALIAEIEVATSHLNAVTTHKNSNHPLEIKGIKLEKSYLPPLMLEDYINNMRIYISKCQAALDELQDPI